MHTYIHAYITIHTCITIHKRIHTREHKYARTCIHTCMHTHINTEGVVFHLDGPALPNRSNRQCLDRNVYFRWNSLASNKHGLRKLQHDKLACKHTMLGICLVTLCRRCFDESDKVPLLQKIFHNFGYLVRSETNLLHKPI